MERESPGDSSGDGEESFKRHRLAGVVVRQSGVIGDLADGKTAGQGGRFNQEALAAISG